MFALAALGLGILVISGDALVRGAVNLSLRLGLPALIVSMTIVAFGTSAPELLIAINAALAQRQALLWAMLWGLILPIPTRYWQY